MTLCIAAIARAPMGYDRIIAVSDQMLSDGSTSLESGIAKIFRVTLRGKWLMLYAGNPSVANVVLRAARAELNGKSETLDEVAGAFQRAYQKEMQKLVEDAVLAPYGLTLKGYTKMCAEFPAGALSGLLDDIKNVQQDNGTDLLLAGFDPAGEAHVVSIGEDGMQVFDWQGYHPIGNGARLADAVLIRTFNRWDNYDKTIYRLLEAKFHAERTPGVGQKTLSMMLDTNGECRGVLADQVGWIREIWEKEATRPIPAEALKQIDQALKLNPVLNPKPPENT